MTPTPMTLGAAAEPAALLPIDDLPLPYLEIDARGIVTRVNRAALALHPPEQGELVGQSAFSFLAGGERETSEQSFSAMMASPDDQPRTVVRYIYDRSGKYSAYELHRAVLRDAAGKPVGMCILGVNVSAATQALEAARSRNLWLESVIDSIHVAVIVTDTTGVITSVNPAAEELLGSRSARLVGKALEEGIHLRDFRSSDNANLIFTMGLTSRSHGLGKLVDRDGREVVVRIWTSPVLDKATGAVAGVVLILYKPDLPLAAPGQ